MGVNDEAVFEEGGREEFVGLKCFAVRTVRPILEELKVAGVSLRESSIHGRGLSSVTRSTSGEMVGEYEGERVSEGVDDGRK